jgi:type IV secretory pathway protease TraF
MKPVEITLNNTHYTVIAVILLAALAAGWWYTKPAPAPVQQYTVAKTASPVKAIPKVNIKPPQVKAYAQAAKKKLTLPAQIQADKHQHVLAATAVPIDPHPQTIVTTIDDQTGEVQTFTRREPLPWLRAEQTGEVSLLYGEWPVSRAHDGS